MKTNEKLLEEFREWMRFEFPLLNSAILSERNPDEKGRTISKLRQLCEKQCERISHVEHIDISTFTFVGMMFSSLCRHDQSYQMSSSILGDFLLKHSARLNVASRFIVVPYVDQQPDAHGRYVTFTTEQAEVDFMKRNREGIAYYSNAANALEEVRKIGLRDGRSKNILKIGVMNLELVKQTFEMIHKELDPTLFFMVLVPFYAPVMNGGVLHRPADARDQPGVFRIDLLLGFASEPYRLHGIIENLPYLTPEDQVLVQHQLNQSSLFEELFTLAKIEINDSPDTIRTKLQTAQLFECAELLTQFAETFVGLSRRHQGLVQKNMNKPLEMIKEAPVYPQFRGLMDQSLNQLESVVTMRDKNTRFTVLKSSLAG